MVTDDVIDPAMMGSFTEQALALLRDGQRTAAAALFNTARMLKPKDRDAENNYAWSDSGSLVFTTRWGNLFAHPDTLTDLMAKLIRRQNEAAAGTAQALPHTRPHDLCHLHATTLPV